MTRFDETSRSTTELRPSLLAGSAGFEPATWRIVTCSPVCIHHGPLGNAFPDRPRRQRWLRDVPFGNRTRFPALPKLYSQTGIRHFRTFIISIQRAVVAATRWAKRWRFPNIHGRPCGGIRTRTRFREPPTMYSLLAFAASDFPYALVRRPRGGIRVDKNLPRGLHGEMYSRQHSTRIPTPSSDANKSV